jgi:hypothetical protein
MARGERRGNREAKKPKQPKAKDVAPVSTFALGQKKVIAPPIRRKK